MEEPPLPTALRPYLKEKGGGGALGRRIRYHTIGGWESRCGGV